MTGPDAVRALRKELGLTQEELAELGGVARLEILHVEKGHSKGSSPRMRRALSVGLGLSLDDLDLLLEGQISVAAALKRSRRARAKGAA